MSVLAIGVSGEEAQRALPPDQDLLFGRAALDSVRLYGGKPFRLDAHIERLARSAKSLELPPVDEAEVKRLVTDVAREAGRDDFMIRIYWTSGRDGGAKQPPDASGEGRAIALAVSLPEYVEELRRRGITLISLSTSADADARAGSRWLLGGVKSGSATNAAAWSEARRRGADDAIMIDLKGQVLEGPGSNIWWRRKRTLVTPGLGLGILPGITRAVIAELAPELGYQVQEGSFQLTHLAAAEEAFVTSTAAEVMPAVELDSRPIGDGAVGPAAVELQSELRALAAAS